MMLSPNSLSDRFVRWTYNTCLSFLPVCFSSFKLTLLRIAGCDINPSVKISSGFKVFGPGVVEIGREVWISQFVEIYVGQGSKVAIADYCDVAPHVIFCTGGHKKGNKRRAGVGVNTDIFVGEGTWIGISAIILGGSHVAPSSFVYPNSVISRTSE